MSGETDLHKLIASMEPVLAEELYIFTCLAESQKELLSVLKVRGYFEEKEGITVIVLKSEAETHNLTYQGTYKCITLNVHSSLEAVGLTAAFSNALADNGISANVVAGFYHDHIFVPEKDAELALASLRNLANMHLN